MKDMKKVEKEIKDELKQASRKSREDMDALKQQVRSEAKEFKKTAGEAFEAHDVEREIRHEPSSINLKKMWKQKQKSSRI